tara:strand:+ start:10842 stop:12383 length:1542 start_codon:yes stop_codon:yes gene_type:complete
MQSFFLNLATRYSLFFPILFYIGERSYIAQDEGYYALQARWIIENGNWIAPSWWNDVVFDRTIGVQWLIAISQKIFGLNIFASHIPSLIASVVSLFLTYEISKELIGKNYAWSTPFILASTYLWTNNAHLATQDMPLLSIEIIGLWSLTTLEQKRNLKLFIIGVSIGLGIMIKSIMVIIPILSITPYIIIYRKEIFKTKLFWFGLIIGLLPFIIWVSFSLNSYGIERVSLLISKINHLSNQNEFSKSYFYYIWNIPANTFPWGLTFLIGIFYVLNQEDKKNKLILFIYPLLFLIQLSLFETKTPYYPLQLTPFIAINSSLALNRLIEDNKSIYKKILSFLGIFICSIALYILTKSFNINGYNNTSFIYLAILTIGISWSLVGIPQNNYRILILSFLGPFLGLCLIVQSGLLTDRDPGVRKIFEKTNISNILENNKVNFIVPNNLNNQEFSNLIKIALYTPNLGQAVRIDKKLENNSFIWLVNTSKDTLKNADNLIVIESSDLISPWILCKSVY